MDFIERRSSALRAEPTLKRLWEILFEDENALQALYLDAADTRQSVTWGECRRKALAAAQTLNRIDKDTSGLLVAAKNDAAHRGLAAQLADHSLCREYEAVVRGTLKEDAGTVEAPIGRHPTDRKRMAVNRKNGKPAVTHWEVLARYRGYTHVRCRLETGRTHQIRVHLASLGHPLLGDGLYGAPCPDKGLEGQCLHARRLRFLHPADGRLVELETPLPDYFEEILKKLGKQEDEG